MIATHLMVSHKSFNSFIGLSIYAVFYSNQQYHQPDADNQTDNPKSFVHNS